MLKLSPLIALLMVLAGGQAALAAEPALEIRFCPEALARPYPLDSLRGVQGLLLQNLAVLNRGSAPVTLSAVEIELLRDAVVVDRRSVSGVLLQSAVKSGLAAKDQGYMDLLAFQYCDGRLLGPTTLAQSPTLASGQALMVSQQPFAWKGLRTNLRAVARGEKGEILATATLKLDGAATKTVFRWPLGPGAWLVGSGASFHTTHRWAVPEEFALDIIQVGADARSFRSDGVSHSDFYAYGAPILAAADGTVAALVTGSEEAPPMLRKPGEEMGAYYGRIGEQQVKNLAAGPPGVVGESVVIDHGNGEYSIYAHLQPGSLSVRVGQRVKAGDPLGRLGSSGNSTEPHLHFQVCDRPDAVSCAALIPNFADLDVANTDGPRPLQSGDLVRGR